MTTIYKSVHELDIHITQLFELRTKMLKQGATPSLSPVPPWLDDLAMRLVAQITAGAHVKIVEALKPLLPLRAPDKSRVAPTSDGYPYG